MKKYRAFFLAAVCLPTVLAACGSERLEDELAYRQIGINNMDAGNYEDALIAFSAALEQHIGRITDTELDICYYKAQAQYETGDKDGAKQTYDALIDYNEKDGKARLLRGCLYLEDGDTEAALADFEAAVKYCDKDYALYIRIYEELAAYNMADKGAEYLNQAFEIKGSGAENLTYRGRIYYLLGQYDNAKSELEGAVKKESLIANLYLAQVYDAIGDTFSAQTYYQAYMDSGQADSVAVNALAEIEMKKGNYAGALTYIRQGLAMEKVTNKRELLYNQIIACEYTGDFSGAWNVIQEYMQEYPSDEKIEKEYIFLKNRQGIKEPEPESEVGTETGTEPDNGTETGTETEGST